MDRMAASGGASRIVASRGAHSSTRTQNPPQRGQRGQRGRDGGASRSDHSWRQTGSVQCIVGMRSTIGRETEEHDPRAVPWTDVRIPGCREGSSQRTSERGRERGRGASDGLTRV